MDQNGAICLSESELEQARAVRGGHQQHSVVDLRLCYQETNGVGGSGVGGTGRRWREEGRREDGVQRRRAAAHRRAGRNANRTQGLSPTVIGVVRRSTARKVALLGSGGARATARPYHLGNLPGQFASMGVVIPGCGLLAPDTGEFDIIGVPNEALLEE